MSSSAIRLIVVLIVLGLGGFFAVSSFLDTGGDQDPTIEEETGVAGEESTEPLTEPELDDPARDEASGLAEVTRETASMPIGETDFAVGTGSLSGRVIDKSGTAVPDAKVTLEIGPANVTIHLPAARKPTGRSTSTDSDGTYHLEDLPAATNYVIVVDHPEYAVEVYSGAQVRESDFQLIPDIVLGHGSKVFGVVRDISGGLVAGAQVELWDQLKANFMNVKDRKPFMTTRTDSAGKYEFINVHFNACEVVVSATGYATSSKSNTMLFAKAQDRELNFQLTAATVIAGIIVDKRGSPIAGAMVEGYQIGQSRDAGASKGQATTSAGGRFTLSGLADGTYSVTAKARGFSDRNHGTVEAGKTDVRIELERRGSAVGQVKDESTGQPVTKYRLHLKMRRNDSEPTPTGKVRFVSSADGRFEFDDIDPGQYVMEAEARGYAPCVSQAFHVRRGETTGSVMIATNRGGTVKGTVATSQGAPVAGALVSLNVNKYVSNPIIEIFKSLPSTIPQREVKTRTNESGEFSLELLIPGTYQVAIKMMNMSPRSIDDVVVNVGQVNDLGRVVLSTGGSIIGKCTDASGRPFADGTVQCSKKEGQGQAGQFATARPDYDGRFEFKNLKPGEYELTLNPEKMGNGAVNPLLTVVYAQKTKITVQVREGGTTQATLVLPPPQ